MKLVIAFLMFLQTAWPTVTGTYRQIPSDHNIRHIPIQTLVIKTNGSYKLSYSATSITADKTILGKWELSGEELLLLPRTLVEAEGQKHSDRRKTNCKALPNDFICEPRIFTIKNDTLFVNEEGWFVKN